MIKVITNLTECISIFKHKQLFFLLIARFKTNSTSVEINITEFFRLSLFPKLLYLKKKKFETNI